jgi:Ca2+-binding RTX toxin-like protein
MAAAPAGTTIRLRTNALIPVPDSLTVTKALNLEPAKGFRPKIGRTGTAAALIFQVLGSARGVSIRGITFRQVKLTVMYSTGTHRTVFNGNVIRLNTGAIGDGGFFALYTPPSKGSVSMRSNDVSASGTGLGVAAGAGAVEVVGNRITAPALATSQIGLYLAAGSGVVRATVASNVIHHTSGCSSGGCPRNGIFVGAAGSAKLNVGILNNTVANLGVSPGGNAIGILVSNPTAPAKVNARLYNNVVANVFGVGFAVLNDADTTAAGDRNNSRAVSSGDVFGGYPMGTTLHREPRFRKPGAGDYRLKSSSKLANAGSSCVAGYPIPRSDAAGRFRYFGAGIDLGAFERGSTVLGSAAGASKTGTNGKNKLVGTNGRDVLCGMGGNDTLLAAGGNDFLFGGLGADKAFGGDGNDRIDLRDGKKGNDAGDGGAGQDVCMIDAQDRRTSC